MRKNYYGFACAVVLLCVFASPLALSQTRGDTQKIDQNMMFQTDQQNVVFDPEPTVGRDSRLEFRTPFSNGTIQPPNGNDIAIGFYVSLLSEVGIDVPEEVIDFATGAGSLFGASISPTFELGLSGEVGGYFEVDSVGTGGIKLDYPMTVPVIWPE